jgi:hypothetical protein
MEKDVRTSSDCVFRMKGDAVKRHVATKLRRLDMHGSLQYKGLSSVLRQTHPSFSEYECNNICDVAHLGQP